MRRTRKLGSVLGAAAVIIAGYVALTSPPVEWIDRFVDAVQVVGFLMFALAVVCVVVLTGQSGSGDGGWGC